MNDRKRIENSFIPIMIYNVIINIVRQKHSQNDTYDNAINISKEVTRVYLEDIDKRKEVKRHFRLYRYVTKVWDYFTKHNFDTRKRLLILTVWAFYLDTTNELDIYALEYLELLQELKDTFETGHETVNNFNKILKSAIKQVPKVHDIVHKHGYFNEFNQDDYTKTVDFYFKT